MCDVAFRAPDIVTEFDWTFLLVKMNWHLLAVHTHKLHFQGAQVYITLW